MKLVEKKSQTNNFCAAINFPSWIFVSSMHWCVLIQSVWPTKENHCGSSCSAGLLSRCSFHSRNQTDSDSQHESYCHGLRPMDSFRCAMVQLWRHPTFKKTFGTGIADTLSGTVSEGEMKPLKLLVLSMVNLINDPSTFQFNNGGNLSQTFHEERNLGGKSITHFILWNLQQQETENSILSIWQKACCVKHETLFRFVVANNPSTPASLTYLMDHQTPASPTCLMDHQCTCIINLPDGPSMHLFLAFSKFGATVLKVILGCAFDEGDSCRQLSCWIIDVLVPSILHTDLWVKQSTHIASTLWSTSNRPVSIEAFAHWCLLSNSNVMSWPTFQEADAIKGDNTMLLQSTKWVVCAQSQCSELELSPLQPRWLESSRLGRTLPTKCLWDWRVWWDHGHGNCEKGAFQEQEKKACVEPDWHCSSFVFNVKEEDEHHDYVEKTGMLQTAKTTIKSENVSGTKNQKVKMDADVKTLKSTTSVLRWRQKIWTSNAVKMNLTESLTKFTMNKWESTGSELSIWWWQCVIAFLKVDAKMLPHLSQFISSFNKPQQARLEKFKTQNNFL